MGPCLALRSQRGIGGQPFLTPHSLQRLDLLEEVADEDVDGGVLLGLPVSQHVLESVRGVFMIEDFLNRETYVQEHSSLDVRVDVEHLVEIDFDVLLYRRTFLVFPRPNVVF